MTSCSSFVFVLLCLLFLFCPIGVAKAQAASPICLNLGAFQIYDGTCKNYYICVTDGNRLVPVPQTCAATAVFDVVAGKCVNGAVCQQTTIPTCTELGIFEIYDGTCRNYYICLNDGEKLVMIVLSCDPTAIFDPGLGKCVPGTMCTQTTTTTTTTMRPTSPTVTAPCVRYGRFPIPDVTCKSYYLCYWNGLRYVIMGNLTCPNTLVFEPVSEKCVPPANYLCGSVIG